MKSITAFVLLLAVYCVTAGDPVTDRWNLNYPDGASPFWRLLCKTRPVYTGRVDPIIVQGSWSAHVHKVFGSSGFSPSIKDRSPLEVYDDLVNGSCTSCNIAKKDMSSYWHPELYYRRPDGTFEVVRGEGLTVYYLSRRGGRPNWWIPFPKGFRMIAGSSERRSFNKTDMSHRAITYSCYGGNGFTGTPQEANGFPGYNNKSVSCAALRLQIFFPTCWNGKDLDTPDHTSHVAYPIGDISQGDCPSTHPYRIPGIFFEAFYNTDRYPHGDGKTTWPFVLSQSDLTGYGMHGDFVSGWNEETLHQALHDSTCNCGNVDCCKTLSPFQQGAGFSCPLDKQVPFFEDVGMVSPIKRLPGCNNFTGEGPSPPKCVSPSPALTSASTGVQRVFIASANKGILTPPWAEPWNLVTINRRTVNTDNIWIIVSVDKNGTVAFRNSLSKGYLVKWVGDEVYSMQNDDDVKTNNSYLWKIVNQANGLVAVQSNRDGSWLSYDVGTGRVSGQKAAKPATAQLWTLSDKTKWTN